MEMRRCGRRLTGVIWGGRIQRSERKAKFLRERSSKEFYASLTRRLGFEGGMGAGRAVFY